MSVSEYLSFGADWLAAYKAASSERLGADPDFARWLDTAYVPIAGGWQY